ncbi:MAG: hypothetical protein MUF58_18520 [Arcicella sp.]|nr:hypothetical protein [Arcicella sp.]
METEVKPKRTYQKHKTEKKITVKHYLNTSIKEYDEMGDSIYSVYVQVTYNRKNTKFKSKIPYHYTDTLPSTVIFDNLNTYGHYFNNTFKKTFECIIDRALTRDVNLIKWLANVYVEANSNNFDISELPKIYHQKSYELTYFVDWCLKQEIQNALSEIKGFDKEINTNYFLKRYLTRVDDDSPALFNLEYLSIEHPELKYLRQKYNSQIWFLSIHLGFQNTSPFDVIDYSDKHVVYLTPTIFDYLSNTFQKDFIDSYDDNQSAKDIISDLDKLFSKYYHGYFDLIINPSKFFRELGL